MINDIINYNNILKFAFIGVIIMKKRILACIVCLCVALSITPTIVFADDKEERVTSIEIADFKVVGDKSFINRTSSTDGNVVIIDQAGNYNITGSTTDYRIETQITDKTKVGTATIVLNGTSIKPTKSGAAIGVAKECLEGTKVTIKLAEGTTNEVLSNHDAGISNLGRELKIVGNGTLNATGGTNSAGIGGGEKGNGSNITISGNARVIAEGGDGGAGIGGGGCRHRKKGGNGSNITISGNSTVNATGGKNGGAGIGGGYYGKGENIEISGSATVNATGGTWGAGIGGGEKGNGSNIIISGSARVTANGSRNGAGIGGGRVGNGSNITISGSATVNATGGWLAAGIGGGVNGDGLDITISDHAIVNATSTSGVGIGGGIRGNGSNISISNNPTITITHKSIVNFGIGIGNGHDNDNSSKITISGGTVTVLNCKPFSNMPDLSGYKSYEIYLNGEKCKDPSDDVFTSFIGAFKIKPVASVSSSPDISSTFNITGSTNSSDPTDSSQTKTVPTQSTNDTNSNQSPKDTKQSTNITSSKTFKTGDNQYTLLIYSLISTISLIYIAFVLTKKKKFDK